MSPRGENVEFLMPANDLTLGRSREAGRREMPAWAPRMGPVASAALLALAFYGLWPLVLIALVPLLVSLEGASPRQAWNRGYAFGLLFSLTQLWWLGDLAYKWIGSPILGVLPWLLASLMSAVYYGLLGRLIRSCHFLSALWAIPLVWAGMELFRSYVPVLAFPWALLGEPLMAQPKLTGAAHLGTIYLVSGIVVWTNLIVRFALRQGLAHVKRAFLIATIPVIFLVSAASSAEKGESLGRIAAGQPGVDMAFDREAEFKIGPAVDALAAEASEVRLMVLPEGITRGGASIPPATNFRVPSAPPIVFGGQRGEGPVFQSAFAEDHGQWSFADKTRLVIFGEFVPGRDYFPFIQDAFHLPGGDLSAGDKLKTVHAGGLTVGPLICFEGLFPDLGLRQARAGAQVLAVMSIDDWFHPWAKARLARAAQWRAVESGLPLVRSGSMGRTMIVSPDGAVIADAPYGKRWLVASNLRKGSGPFSLVWFFPALALGSLVAIPVLARRIRSARRAEGSATLIQ